MRPIITIEYEQTDIYTALWAAMTAFAKDYVKDAEPAILEVHYTRIEVTDTTKRNSHFFKDPVMLRIGKNKSVLRDKEIMAGFNYGM